MRGKDDQIAALMAINTAVRPDILLLTKVDFDLEMRTGHALRDALGYTHAFALAPNSMVTTSLDLDGDGNPGDRQSWARYAGEGAMLALSQYPLSLKFHLGDVLWKDVPDAQMAVDAAGKPFPSPQAQDAQKLVSQGLWVIEAKPKQGDPVTLALFQNQTPVFDGPEDLNGLRNAAQLGLLSAVIDGQYGAFPSAGFVVMGNANLDPNAGAGDWGAISKLLANTRLQDAHPRSPPGSDATAIWEKPGPMRVSYILPSKDWVIQKAEVFWPDQGPRRDAAEQASRHRMVWMQIRPPPD
jgi:hypothetical protein